MKYRMLSPTGDYTFGQSLANFYINQIECVSQSILTRLRLNQGDWFLDITAGVPWNSKILGKSSPRTRDIVLKTVLLGTTGVTELTSFSVSLNTQRKLSYTATVSTIYSSTLATVAGVI
jgi:hypothetical protein